MLVDFEDGRPRPARSPELIASARHVPEHRSRTGGAAELHLQAPRPTTPRPPAWLPPPPISASQPESLAPVILACLATLLIAVAVLAASVMSASA